ncbi:polar amino acid ABC transporter inner membrane subunit [Nitratireductor aquibiodomus RA22]|uniref:Polar amino acid ABC transporter inner membrane subunit n=1 Tax=Nitratireductor aquibiodomus RA22 TaxID=1189611 RepID=I5C023_9HYPH|nr:polar amino acid ABC transporter inner membrane subunit [Nitratireductor aquibiodomus RA22]
MAVSGSRPATKRDFPWWLAVAGAIALGVALLIATSDLYAQVFAIVSRGIGITVFVTVVGFALATAVGLGIALMSLSGSLALRQIARFYVEIIRGVPVLVLLFWIAFAGVPIVVTGWNAVTASLQEAGILGELRVRDISLLWRAIIALSIGYSAFIAEVFRAGIQSVDEGQVEAAKRSGFRASSVFASLFCRRRSAPSCRRSAMISWPWSRIHPSSRCSALPTSPRWARSMRRARSAFLRPIPSLPISISF